MTKWERHIDADGLTFFYFQLACFIGFVMTAGLLDYTKQLSERAASWCMTLSFFITWFALVAMVASAPGASADETIGLFVWIFLFFTPFIMWPVALTLLLLTWAASAVWSYSRPKTT